MSTPTGTSSTGSNKRSAYLAVPDTSARLVAVILGVVVALTFLFGFGNVLTLGLRLGVPIWVAPLVAPAVDLSIAGLLASRQLAVTGGPVKVLRSARRLLIFASTVGPIMEDDPLAALPGRPGPGGPPERRPRSAGTGGEAGRQDLLHRARAEDVLHWQQHQRPISAETLRKRLHIGASTARDLVTQLRTHTHHTLHRHDQTAAT